MDPKIDLYLIIFVLIGVFLFQYESEWVIKSELLGYCLVVHIFKQENFGKVNFYLMEKC